MNRKANLEKNDVKKRKPEDTLQAVYDALLEGRALSTLAELPGDFTAGRLKSLQQKAEALIAERGEISRSVLMARNVARLEMLFGEARKLGDFKHALGALIELNKLKNLYQLSTGDSNQAADLLANMSDAELDAAYQAEIEVELSRRGRTIQ